MMRFSLPIYVLGLATLASTSHAQQKPDRSQHGKESEKTVVVKIDGKSVSLGDLKQLRKQRRLAESFFKLAYKKIHYLVEKEKREVDKIVEKLAVSPKQPDAATFRRWTERQHILQLVVTEIDGKLKKNHFFETGVTLRELVDILLWSEQAKRRKIVLTTDAVWNIAKPSLFMHIISTENAVDEVFGELNQKDRAVTKQVIGDALRKEFTVKIAKRALTQSLPYMVGDTRRVPMSPFEMWAYFQKNRTEYDVAILPIRAEHFLSNVKNPTDQQLQDFFKKHRKTPYNPASPIPGFALPERVKVEWVSADPNSDHYVKQAESHFAKLLQALAMMPPGKIAIGMPAWSMLQPPFIESYLESALLNQDYEKRKERVYRSEAKYSPANLAFEMAMYKVARHAGIESRWTNEDKAKALAKKRPVFDVEKNGKKLTWTQAHKVIFATWLFSGTRLEIAMTTPMIGAAGVYAIHEEELRPLLQQEQMKRVQQKLDKVDLALYLPFQLVKAGLRERRIRGVAKAIAADVMKTVYYELDTVCRAEADLGNLNPQERIRPVIADLVKHFGLRHGRTPKFYHKYDIHTSRELKKLRNAFESSDLQKLNPMMGIDRANWLWTSDFHRLFFDGVPQIDWADRVYAIRNWPPVIRPKSSKWIVVKKGKKNSVPVYLLPQFDDQRFLFWRTDARKPSVPKTIEETDSLAMQEWKKRRAFQRHVIPYAALLAKKAITEPASIPKLLKSEAASKRERVLVLPKVARLYPIALGQFQRAYLDVSKLFTGGRTEFSMEKDLRKTCNFPRNDLGKHLVQLLALDQPIVTGIDAVDAWNRKLHAIYKKKDGKLAFPIQIATNQPQTELYIMAVLKRYPASKGEFLLSYRFAAAQMTIDPFAIIAQQETAEKFAKSLRAQLRRMYCVEWVASPETRKRFDQR